MDIDPEVDVDIDSLGLKSYVASEPALASTTGPAWSHIREGLLYIRHVLAYVGSILGIWACCLPHHLLVVGHCFA